MSHALAHSNAQPPLRTHPQTQALRNELSVAKKQRAAMEGEVQAAESARHQLAERSSQLHQLQLAAEACPSPSPGLAGQPPAPQRSAAQRSASCGGLWTDPAVVRRPSQSAKEAALREAREMEDEYRQLQTKHRELLAERRSAGLGPIGPSTLRPRCTSSVVITR